MGEEEKGRRNAGTIVPASCSAARREGVCPMCVMSKTETALFVAGVALIVAILFG